MYGVTTIGKLNPISNCYKETLALYLAKRLMVKMYHALAYLTFELCWIKQSLNYIPFLKLRDR